MAKLHLVAGIEHEKSSAARADDFAPKGAACHGAVIPGINVNVTHALRAFLLPLPMYIHQARELVEVSRLERFLALLTQVLDEMEVLHHPGVALLALIILFFKNAGCAPRIPGKEEKQIVFEIEQGLFGYLQWRSFNASVRHETKVVYAAVG